MRSPALLRGKPGYGISGILLLVVCLSLVLFPRLPATASGSSQTTAWKTFGFTPTHTHDNPFETKLSVATIPQISRRWSSATLPGGVIRLTESEWWYYSSSPALETLNALLIRALKQQGDSFSQSGRFTGVLPLLGRFLRQAGCTTVSYRPHVIDYSFGSPAYEGFRQDAAAVFKLFQPFLVKTGVATQPEVDQLYQQMQAEMRREDFRGLLFPLTTWGEKP